MTTKPILNCFILLIVCCSSAFAQVGDTCVVKSTGVRGVCRISSNCPIVEEQAQNGISPTICGYYQLTVPIVCCEESPFVQPNDDTLLNPEPNLSNQQPSYSNSNSREPSYSNSNSREPSYSNSNSREPSYSNSNSREPSYSNSNSREPSYSNSNSREPSYSNSNSREPSYSNSNNRQPSPSQNREPNPNIFPAGEPDAVIYPDSDNQPSRPQVTHTSKSEQKCQEYSKAITGVVQAIPLVTNTEVVSYSFVKCDYNGVALIVGGKPASAGEFPFMAAIGFYVDNKVEWRCGGTLISEEYVLTAAHCTYTRDGDTPKIVRLGDLDLSRDDDGSVHTDYNVRNIVVHPRYRYPLKYNDIALIQLSTTVRFTKFIRPACLYTKSQVELPQAIATGWGKTDYAAAEISDKLMKVSLNIYSNDRCAQTYQTSKHLPQGIKSNMICAGELRGGQDTCQGDSGGPLLITKKGNQCKFYVIGVTSFGKSCGQANTPAIYTRVSEYVPWIEKTIW
ncbi:serine protease P44 [Tribolium castaneum]|uniref:Serine protease P44 n=1 Tax=Tribolium castaneum TaxID=7070 RepID=D6W6R5_TRICA|nr:PREDICTED: serine protease snake [Tribolium castaneum]XP_015834290.1 PREDICTED: serine protease snake [Tribolium castaneum]EFA11559.1 serine protease P44 [Tribolium castaneum]|eukprot:XP_008200062.1 PREDICTED: serine protease snake [Tribolium castaneum]